MFRFNDHWNSKPLGQLENIRDRQGLLKTHQL